MHRKVCRRCGKKKQLSEFYKHPMMADGHLNICKECKRGDSAEHRQKNIDAVRAYDRERAKNPERVANAAAMTKRWRAEDSRRAAAHSAVARAVRSGALVKKPCERCGSENSLAHHEDYDKPLDVVWLCQPDHKQRHKELALEGREP